MSAKVLSIINYKGGVGKTTSTFNIGASLYNIYNELSRKDNLTCEESDLLYKLGQGKVLLIDLDPQSSLSNVCLKKVKNDTSVVSMNVTDLHNEETLNYMFESYLTGKKLGVTPNFVSVIPRMIKKNIKGFDFIPSTMQYTEQGYSRGLDYVEIKMNRRGDLDNLFIISKFIHENRLDEEYDFIIFDCPPANNTITQNALLMSDYYIIPSIMDGVSNHGIIHLVSLIEKTIIKSLKEEFGQFIEMNGSDNYLKFFNRPLKQLGVFETLRKTGTQNDQETQRELIGENIYIFEETIHHYNQTAQQMSKGISCSDICYTTKYDNGAEYKDLTISMLKRM